jgi:hypothetical protein
MDIATFTALNDNMSNLTSVEDDLRNPPVDTWPELRWWLAAGHHTDITLRNEVDAAHKLGFGGMEFLAMPEEGIDNSRYAWGTEEWHHSTEIILQETTKRGMSFSMTNGTNWSNANLPSPFINADHRAAAMELDFIYEDIPQGGSRALGEIPRIDLEAFSSHVAPFHGPRAPVKQQQLVAVVAAELVDNSKEPAVLGRTEVITDLVEHHRLEWTPEPGHPWRLFFFYIHGTGQLAHPSPTMNHVINYLDKAGVETLKRYWAQHVLTEEVKAACRKNPRAQMYMDSLELVTGGEGGMFWSADMVQEFQRRRGYDVTKYLPFLVRAGEMASMQQYRFACPLQNEVTIGKVRFDMHETWTDLYMEYTLAPLQDFLHGYNIKLRAEISYGAPFELSRPGIYVDGVETESLEFASQIDAYRLLSGVAHLFGKQYSSETGATVRNFMLPHSFYDQIIKTQLSAGVTKQVLHGWASMAGSEATSWPGHEGMWPVFSERFDLRQPGKEFYPLWSRALARKQLLLRKGVPRKDVGILRTDHVADNMLFLAVNEQGKRIADEEVYGKRLMRERVNLWWEDLGMQDAGWTYEFFDGRLLLQDGIGCDQGIVQDQGPGYQALIVYQSTLVRQTLCSSADAQDCDVAKRLLDWAKQGLRIVFVHDNKQVRLYMARSFEHHARAAASTPGLDGRDDDLGAIVAALLSLDNVREAASPADALSVLRELGITGRSEFSSPNREVLSYLRHDGPVSYLYLYHFMYESGRSTTVQVKQQGHGTTYRLDEHAGTLESLPSRIEGNFTLIEVNLRPGEDVIIVLNCAERPIVIEKVSALETSVENWSLKVESWDKGQVEQIKEDRGLGYETVEYLPHPSVETIVVGPTPLSPWKDIPQVGGAVSGVGEYKASFVWSTAISLDKYILDLGDVSGGLGHITINGSSPIDFDTLAPQVNITKQIKEGVNHLTVRISSSLNNRLIANEYYGSEPEWLAEMLGKWPDGENGLVIRKYGLLGPVKVKQIVFR